MIASIVFYITNLIETITGDFTWPVIFTNLVHYPVCSRPEPDMST